MNNPKQNLIDSIKTLKSNGFVVCAQSPSCVRLKKNENWIEIDQDECSFLAYNIEGKEYFIDADATDLNLVVKLAVELY